MHVCRIDICAKVSSACSLDSAALEGSFQEDSVVPLAKVGLLCVMGAGGCACEEPKGSCIAGVALACMLGWA